MPNVLIEVRKHYTADSEQRLMETVHDALVTAFGLRPQDRCVKLVAYEPNRFLCPTHLALPELYTQIAIECFSGRSLEAKRNLYRTIVGNLEELGIPRDHVQIMIREIPPENWGIRGGQAACDLELGYRVDV